MESKRFYVGNLFPEVKEADLKKLFAKHGSVDKVEIKTKTDIDGNVMTTFAFVTVGQMPEHGVAECIKQFNNLKWKKHTIKVQQAQESFLSRLQKEREEAAKKAKKIENEQVKSYSDNTANLAKNKRVYESDSDHEDAPTKHVQREKPSPKKLKVKSPERSTKRKSSAGANKIISFSDDENGEEAAPKVQDHQNRLSIVPKKRVYYSSSDDDSDDGETSKTRAKSSAEVMSKLESFNSGFWKDDDVEDENRRFGQPRRSENSSKDRDKNLRILDSMFGDGAKNANLIPVGEKPVKPKNQELEEEEKEEAPKPAEQLELMQRYDPSRQDHEKFVKPSKKQKLEDTNEANDKPVENKFWMSSVFSKDLEQKKEETTASTPKPSFSLLSTFGTDDKDDLEDQDGKGEAVAENEKSSNPFLDHSDTEEYGQVEKAKSTVISDFAHKLKEKVVESSEVESEPFFLPRGDRRLNVESKEFLTRTETMDELRANFDKRRPELALIMKKKLKSKAKKQERLSFGTKRKQTYQGKRKLNHGKGGNGRKKQ